MRTIEPIAKIGDDIQSSKTPVLPVPTGGPAPTALPVVEYGKDSASLSGTAAIVNRMRATVASEGGIRPPLVAQLKHELAQLEHNLAQKGTATPEDIERAIARLLQEL